MSHQQVTLIMATSVALASLTAQNFRVSAVAPAPGAITVSPAGSVELTFNQNVNAATVNATNIHVLGRWSGVVPGRLSVVNSNRVRFEPSRPYFAGEMVTLYASRNVAASGGGQLVGGYFTQFWVQVARGSAAFTHVRTISLRRTGEFALSTYGIYAGDLDHDGSPDVIAANEATNDIRILLNDGCGGNGPMSVVGLGQLRPSPSEGADFDRDGKLDVTFGGGRGDAFAILLGDGVGGFLTPRIFNAGGFVHGIGVMDANADGYPDVAAPITSRVAVCLNDGTGNFGPPILFEAGSAEDNIGVADANGDGIADLFIGNAASLDVAVLLGDGLGAYRLGGSILCGGGPFQMAVGDVNADGRADAVTANRGTNTVGVCLGDGQGGFTANLSFPTGLDPTAVDLADMDGDGDLDAVCSNYRSSDWYVHWNNGSGNFSTFVVLPAFRSGSCATLVDFDRDGDVDILGTDEVLDEVRVYLQDGPAASGAQPRSCAAALRVNNWANLAGYSTGATQVVARGADMFLGVSGAPGSAFAIVLGFAQTAGFASPWGLFNLRVDLPAVILLEGFSGNPRGITDSKGEALEALFIPAHLPIGANLTFQAIVADAPTPSTFQLTNPQSITMGQ